MSQPDVIKNVGKGVVVGGVAVVVFMFVVLLAGLFGSSDLEESKDLRSERIKPLGQINIIEERGVVAPVPVAQKTGPAKSGQEVYNSACMACHATGIAGAPKYGDEAAWAPKVAKGEAILIESAINGLNAMPPRGGNPDFSDEEIKAAVRYILKAVGGSSAEAAIPEPPATSTATQATAPSKSGEEVYNSACSVCHAVGIVGAPKFGDKDIWAPRIAKGRAALINSAFNGLNAMPPRGGNPDLSEEEVKAAVDYMLEAVSEKPAEPAKTPTAPAVETPAEPITTSPAPSSHDLTRGEQVYQTACNACHGTGIVGSPKLGDKQAWESRVTQGMETLFSHALNGFQGNSGIMPPKGGSIHLPDDDIKAAVAYMISKVK